MPALHRLLLPSAARLLPLVALALPIHAASLSYREFLVAPLSLTVSVGSTDAASGDVTLNGNDTQRPTTPFSVVWGDGQTTTGFFPLRHTYADRLRNYAPRVTATYADRSTASVEVIVRFTTVQLSAYAVPAEVAVSLPAVLPALSSTVAGYAIPAGLAPFGSGVFAVHRREVFERVLGAFAVIERDLVNDNLHRTDGTFRQLALALPANHPSYAF